MFRVLEDGSIGIHQPWGVLLLTYSPAPRAMTTAAAEQPGRPVVAQPVLGSAVQGWSKPPKHVRKVQPCAPYHVDMLHSLNRAAQGLCLLPGQVGRVRKHEPFDPFDQFGGNVSFDLF